MRLRAWLITLMFLGALLVLATESRAERPAPAHAVEAMRTEVLPANSEFFIAIGRCEQPAPADKQRKDGSWQKGYEWGINWHHPGPTYPGGLGVFAPLWTEDGIDGRDLAPTIPEATPAEQMIHAQRIIDKYGPYAWGCTGRALAVAPLVDIPKP